MLSSGVVIHFGMLQLKTQFVSARPYHTPKLVLPFLLQTNVKYLIHSLINVGEFLLQFNIKNNNIISSMQINMCLVDLLHQKTSNKTLGW